MRTMKLAQGVDLAQIAAQLPPNFTGADFGALTSEAYMIATKERIAEVQQEIETFKSTYRMSPDEDLLPETFFKLKHPGNQEMQAQELVVEVRQEHLLQSLHQVTPSISL